MTAGRPLEGEQKGYLAINRKTLMLVLSSGVIAVLVVAGFALKSYLDPFDDQPFSKSAWSTGNLDVRRAMARDAIGKLPVGMTSGQVRKLLGQAKPVPRDDGNVDIFGNRLKYSETWAYYLGGCGLCSLYGLDDVFLSIHFDSDEKVALVEITGG